MNSKAAVAHDVEALNWNDIEALPYYVGALVIIAAFFEGLSYVGPMLRADAAKAFLLVALMGVRWAFLREGGNWSDDRGIAQGTGSSE